MTRRGALRTAAVAAATALLAAGGGTAAYADGVEDLLVWQQPGDLVGDVAGDLPPVQITTESPQAVVARQVDAIGGSTSCSAPTADGRMVAPGATATGTTAKAFVSGVFTCVGTSGVFPYPATATVTDYYLVDGAYRAGRSFTASMGTSTGTSVVAPWGVAEYSPTGVAVNTWHYVRVVATTPWGATLYDNSELYYLAAA